MEFEKKKAIEAVLKAARLCQQVQSDLAHTDSIEKDDRSPVTIADFGSQALICQAICDAFPGDAIMAEENSSELSENPLLLERVASYVNRFSQASTAQVCDWLNRGNGEACERFWTLDPIDGTKGFLRNRQYAIALALIVDGEVRLGVLACPNLPHTWGCSGAELGSLLVAIQGSGAYMHALDGHVLKQIQVADTPLRFAESHVSAHGDCNAHVDLAQNLDITEPSIRIDSQAKYGLLARGEVSAYIRLPNPKTPDYRERIWDHAAGIIVVDEAGGKVTDAEGKSLNFLQGKQMTANRGILATNGKLHNRMLEGIRALKHADAQPLF